MKNIYNRYSIISIFIWFSMLSAITPVSGQYSVGFSRVYGGDGFDEGFALDFDEEFDLLITGGRSFSSNEYLHENAGGSDYWIMQQDADGDTLWSRSYGGFDNDDLRALKYNPAGGITAFGTTWSESSGDVPGHGGLVGAWLMTTDDEGNPDLSVVYSGMFGEQGVDFEHMAGGGHTLLIQSSSPMLNGEMSRGNFDFWVARVDDIGSIIWSEFYGGLETEIPVRIIRSGSGFYLIGSTSSVQGDITDNSGGFDYWIVRINLDGDLIWQKTFGGSGDDLANDALLMPDGSVMIVGESNSANGDKSVALGGNDIWLVHVDADGNLISERTYGGTDDDSGQDIVMAGNSRIALLANTESADVDLRANKGRQDVWIAYLTLNGTVAQQMNYGGTLDEWGNDLIATSDSLVFMTGTSNSDDGNLDFPGYDLSDLWLMRMGVDSVPCADNGECFLNNQVNFAILEPETNGAVVCINACNRGATKGPTGPPGCTNFLGAAAWFRVRTGDNAEVMSLTVRSPEMNTPQILVMKGHNCLNFSPLNCDYGLNGFASIINLEIDPDTAYYVIVGDAGGLEGAFDLCVSVADIDFCNRNPSLYVNATSLGSPFAGPFQPGEEVQICYEVNAWDKVECNGLQGIVPEFGVGWDSLSFNSMGRPKEIDTALVSTIPNGDWEWWPLGSVHYNFTNPVFGYNGGQTLPTGWYFVNYNDPPPNEDPDESIGDLDDCINDESRWKVCFTIRTKEECTSNLDCSVTIKTFADGEIGSIVSQACQSDPPLKLNRTLNCCLNPTIDPIPNFTICSGDTVIITLESSLNPPAVYTYGVNVSGSIIGANPGTTGNLIFQQLTNVGTQAGTVTYTVRGTSQTCATPFEEFIVTVLPQPTGQMALAGSPSVCRGDFVNAHFEFSGTAPFIAEYAVNGVVQPPILSDANSMIVPIQVMESGLVTFVGFEDRFCPGDPNGAFTVIVLEPGERTLDFSICEGDSIVVAGHTISFPGNYELVLPNASENGCDSIVHVNLDVHENYERNMEMEICEGEVVVIGTQVFDETGFYSVTLPTAYDCDSVINLLLTVTNEIIEERSEVLCAGESLEFGGETIFEDGTYFDTVALSATCDSIYILHVNVLNVIVLIQTVIEPDTGSATGSIMIQVAGGFGPYTYLWSNGDTTNHPMGLEPGNYSLTVTDVVGCTVEYNFFLVSSVEDLLPGFDKVTVYPNPVWESRNITVDIRREGQHAIPMAFKIYDVHGNLLHAEDRTLLRSEEIVDLPGVAVPGMYLLLMEDQEKGGAMVRRFVVQ